MPTLIESTGGVAVALNDLGGPDGAPVLLLVHATGMNAGAWRPFAAALREAHRVLAIDVRAHGAARTPEEPDLRWPSITDDVVAVLDSGALPAGPLHGIGHSMGGACLVLAAQRRPDAFRSLWLFEPVIPPPGRMPTGSGENPMAEGAERRRASFPSLDAAYDNYASKPPLDAFHPDALRGYVEAGFEPAGGEVTLRCRPAWEAATFRMGGANGVWEVLPRLELPVTIAAGAATDFGPAAFADEVAERLPRGRLERHPELGHFGPLQDPDGLASGVAAWVAGG